MTGRIPFALGRIPAAIAAIFAGSMAFAADGTDDIVAKWEATPGAIFDASEVSLDAFLWVARPVVVFADTPADPAFQQQIELLQARIDELVERDVVLIVDTDRSDPGELRRKLRPRGFMLTVIGKDGGVKLRKPFPWNVRELTRSIDKMPLRQTEIREAAQSSLTAAE